MKNYIEILLDAGEEETYARITSSFVDTVYQFPFEEKNGLCHNKFRITVKNMNTKKYKIFYFYGSFNDFRIGKTNMSATDIYEAFNCLLMEVSGEYDSFEEFCQEFNYDDDSRKSEKVYKALKKNQNKMLEILSRDELDKLQNYVEKYLERSWAV